MLADIVSAIKDRPGIYFGRPKIDSIIKLGFFLNGYLAGECAAGEFDEYFFQNFKKFIVDKYNIEVTDFKFWFEIIDEYAGNDEEAVKMFFDNFDEFYSLYEINELQTDK